MLQEVAHSCGWGSAMVVVVVVIVRPKNKTKMFFSKLIMK
jgi:hypothetical protein